MQRCTVVRGRRAKRMRADDEGRPTGGEVYTLGGGRGEDPSAKKVKNFLDLKIYFYFYFFVRNFFIIFLGELEILRGLVCSFVLVCGRIGTEGFGCSFLEEQSFLQSCTST